MFEVDILTNLPKNLTVGLQVYKLGCLMLEKLRNGKLLKEFEKSSNDCVQFVWNEINSHLEIDRVFL